MAVGDVAFAVVDAEHVQRILWVGVFGIEEEGAVGAFLAATAFFIKVALVVGGEIVLGENVVTIWAGEFPGAILGVDLPVLHADWFFAGRTIAVGPDHP